MKLIFHLSQGSNDSRFQRMYQYMMDNAKDVLTEDNEPGVEKVKNENYAFMMESSSIEYIQERECNLSIVGNNLDSKGYGIAMRKSLNIFFSFILTPDC